MEGRGSVRKKGAAQGEVGCGGGETCRFRVLSFGVISKGLGACSFELLIQSSALQLLRRRLLAYLVCHTN